LVEDVAGKTVADSNAKEKGKTLRTILRDCLAGANGRPKAEGWVPRWLRFPASGYTARGGVWAASRSAAVAGLIAPEAEGSDPPAEPEAADHEAAEPDTTDPDSTAPSAEPVREAA
jgi:ParB family chromosome partitioning protein